MAEALKHLYSKEYIRLLSAEISKSYSAFPIKQFHQIVFDKDWAGRELKQRMRHISECLQRTLPEDYSSALAILMKTYPRMTGLKYIGFANMCFADFVELYGVDHYALSIPALEFFTIGCSSEFAVRPFIIKYPDLMMKQMLIWAHHPHEHVRRLASEGCRPRLPWAMGLPEFKKNPLPILPILEALKSDPSEFVRRSVANNLNDIAKDHPKIVLSIAQQWTGQSKETDWVIKHGCRTLLKRGHTEALEHFGFKKTKGVQVSKLRLSPSAVKIGGKLSFSFSIRTPATQKLRMEYSIDFVTSRGNYSKKIFKIAENTYEKNKIYPIVKSHSFRHLTVRKHFEGRHTLSIIVNGSVLAAKYFQVNRPRR
ncbi:DNA alkylation repair protein [bacterium]|nr:DNA alkylation repair protein [bacterium]